MSLGVSVHTVHEYVKELHRRLGVTSRGELISRFLPSGTSPHNDANAGSPK